MNKIVSLCKRRGFVFPGSEIYGGLANTWDYGPLGSQLKKNIKDSWWKTFVERRQDIVGIDSSILMNPRVWEASGHVETFNDPLVEDKITHKRFRADHLIQEMTGENVDGKSLEELAAIIEAKSLKSPDGNALTPPRQFSGMFETTAGAAGEGDQVIYLRPETAQAIFVNFKNVLDTTRIRLPFGIAQIGKAFRNEITPGNFTFRTLEFEQMEIEYFLEEQDWQAQFETWADTIENWGKQIGIDIAHVHRLEVAKDALAHYSKRTVDFEFDFPFGTKELWGLAYRTDFDLTNHQNHSKQKLEYTDPDEQSKKVVPHVIEPSLGVDRTLLALLTSAYTEEEVPDSKGGTDTRVVMKFVPALAPYQVAVLPLSKKDQLIEPAQKLVDQLLPMARVEFDASGSIGKRYRRQDEIGTPFCVTVDFETLEDKAVTVRDRDTMQQTRVPIVELTAYLAQRLAA
ncbi:glycine--tRNA ligase [Candidatus Uhrbacteria bacterium CG10_big_fil_rev_8_21_14_0_10_50_16]|uniref:Glycine--tRNA ligase n=1 Tax=Candidatus Uhrbacteria bacterium CG10_big_fil_rev_8_21_14_0_10_50_16 TaxID=1975039 RepID=A0A2H0RQ54_9BACT|nr:MAG: glycine--tRNA ligase [Candidatus Uhrbacteria bacterium CG10_big_fil_rev_8_21_14_0_10_50_16]